jgi:hypothetical protein
MKAMDQADDLKAFERRMIEIVSSLQPSIWRWRVILAILIFVTVMTFYAMCTDDTTNETSISSLDSYEASSFLSLISAYLFRKQIYFSVSFILLISTFLFGIHRKMFASTIIINRFRYILADYNMSCDSDGRLILKPRPNPYPS